MQRFDLEDTIAAISTPLGDSGIGIVRISGKLALSIADKMFKAKDGKPKPSSFDTYTTHYGHIYDGNQLIDEVILTVMKAPKSYTKEDIVEMNCHSGIVALRKALEAVLKNGARLAQPGEFTKRAFLSGRIDLAQAEAVLDIISSKTELSLKVAVNQLGGILSNKIKDIRNELLDIYANIEASIDFPTEDIQILKESDIENKLNKIIDELKKLEATADEGIILRQGVSAVICGKPNVGKSSLMNAFLRQNRVIVTSIPGTTRDVVEEIVNVKGIPLKIADTAGIIEPKDLPLPDKEGIQKSIIYLKRADLVLFILDSSQPFGKDDKIILEHIKDKKFIVVLNKVDLPNKLNLDLISNQLNGKKIVKTSLIKQKGLDELEETIIQLVLAGHISSCDEPFIANIRHKQATGKAIACLKRSRGILKKRISPECCCVDIKEAIDNLGLITGETVSDDILERIFEKFCIGK